VASQNSSGTARFVARNVDCNSNSNWGAPSVSRSGKVLTAGPASPSGGFFLSIGQGKAIDVPFTTGTAGTGRVIVQYGVDSPGATLIDTVVVNVQ
jgi:hypothetical protein